MEILGIDAGNENVKVATRRGVGLFSSWVGEYRDRKFITSYGADDMIWECDGKKGFAGTLAKMECELGGSRKGGSKAHEEAKLRVLLALHRFAADQYVNIVVGQPINSHTDEEKRKIKEMLIGPHTITVNGIEKKFVVNHCEVAAEGGAAAMSDPMQGLQRYIDIGSGSINYATTYNMAWMDRGSFTENFGMATIWANDMEQMARRICLPAIDKWSSQDNVRVMGGAAQELLRYMQGYFPSAKLLQPKMKRNERIEIVQPIYGNAVGNLNIGIDIYEAA